jgi:methionine synthase I (cobalamin-dependent)
LVAAGARFIGGCCGSTPAHVAAIVAAINGIRASQADS